MLSSQIPFGSRRSPSGGLATRTVVLFMCACSFLAVDALFLPATLSSGLPSQPAAEAHDGAGKATPPPARRDDVVDDLHGVRVPDPYRWLEDQSSAETRAWIEKENEYSKPILSSLPGREDL